MNQTGPQYDPQPGDTQTWTGTPEPGYYRQMTVLERISDRRVKVRTDYFDGTSREDEQSVAYWSLGDADLVFDRPVAEAPAPSGPQFDPQPGDTMTYHQNGVAHNVRTVTAVDDRDVHFDMRWARGGSTNVDYGRSMSRETWALDDDGTYTYARPEAPAAPEAPAPAPKAEGPRFDPQPGDTMTFHYCDGPANVRTVKARDGDNVDFEVRWVRNDRTYLGSMSLEDWQDDGEGDYTYARPVAPQVRTAEDARVDPQPGDTMTYAHDEDVYTVTSTDADSVTCTVRLPRTNWSDAWDGEWVYAPGVPATPHAQAKDDMDYVLEDLDGARTEAAYYKAEAETARALADKAQAQADASLAMADKAGALAERVTGHLAASEAFATTAALYLTACRAVMSPDQHAVVEILVGLAPRA